MRFEIIAGARRFRASTAAGLTHLPVVIRLYSDAQAVEIMAIENGQRDDVLPLEEAAGYKALLGLEKGYSPALIAERIGHTEQFVRNRLRLLELVPDARALLESGRIGVEHAEVIAKLKPADQKRVIAREHGGLFEQDFALEFDETLEGRTPAALDRAKPRSLRELKQWIARHIRFDLRHAAVASPHEFGPVAAKVEEAAAAPGRGKKVIPITFERYCPDAAKDDGERTYGSTAWRKAEGKDRQPTCEHAVLGLVVAGEQYGTAFHVCIARDKCQLHFKREIAERDANQKLRATGRGQQAAKKETKSRQDADRRWKEEQAQRERKQKAWQAAVPAILEAVAAAVKKAKSPMLGEFVLGELIDHTNVRAKVAPLLKGGKSAEDYLRLGVLCVLSQEMNYYNAEESFAKQAKRFGVDVAAILKASAKDAK